MFNFKAFLLEHWRNAEMLHRFLVIYGINDLKRDSIYKWFLRGTIPAEWFAVLIALLELEKGKPVSVAGYLNDRPV
jgi:hypothetical protein